MNNPKIIHVLWIFINFIMTSSISPGLAPGTKVVTTNGSMLIEDLVVGSKIKGYNPVNNSFIDITVEKIQSKETASAYLITTDKGMICASNDQLFFEVTTNDFIKTEQLKTGHILRTMDNKECLCISIDHKNISMPMYDLTLQEPHLYFSSDACVLTHNMITAFESDLIWITSVITAIAGYCVAMVCLYNDKPTGTLCKPDNIEKKVYNDMNDFCLKHYYGKSDYFPENYKQNVATPNNQKPSKGGIALNLDLFKNMAIYPLRYGSLYPLAFMTNTGSVACVILAPQFNYRASDGTRYWKMTEFGKEIFPRTHPFVKAFVEAEDKMQLDALQAAVKKWPSTLMSKLLSSKTPPEEKNRLHAQNTNLEQTIYGMKFGIEAVYHMIEKKLAPSLVLQTIQNNSKGICFSSKDSNVFFDSKQDIVVIFDKNLKKIIDVGYYSSIKSCLNEELVEKDKNRSIDLPSIPPIDPKDPKDKNDKDKAKEVLKLKSDDSINKVLQEAKPESNKRFSDIYEKAGGDKQRLEDFSKLKLENIEVKSNGTTVGMLPDGRLVNSRVRSTDGRPTIEIQQGNRSIKIRYNS